MSATPDRFPAELANQERDLVEQRRRTAQLGGAALNAPHAGLALSGGGIRSATFCLGVLQALAKRGLLRRFDYLSTVSGGGYVGSFFGAWVNRDDINQTERGLAGSDGQDAASLPVRFLRENGRYLTPNGSTDAWLSACVQVRNQAAIMLLMLLPVVGTLLGAEAIKAWFGRLPAVFTATMSVTSVFWPVASALALIVALPLACAYWFVGSARDKRFLGTLLLLCAAGAAGIVWCEARLLAAWPAGLRLWPTGLSLEAWRAWGHAVREIPWADVGGWTVATAACLAMVVALIIAGWATPTAQPLRRRQYSDLLAQWMGVVAIVALFATVDTLGQWVAREVHSALALASGPITLAAVVAVAQRLGPWLAKLGDGSRLKLSGKLLAWIAASVVALTILVFTSAALHTLAIAITAAKGNRLLPAVILLGAGLGAWFVAFLLGRDFHFVNHSSLHRIYSARLSRTYIGASNPERTGAKARNFDATDVLRGDDIPVGEYAPHLKGGPLHLINVTVNETVSGQSNVDKEDRHGLGMAVGPVALSVGPHASLPRADTEAALRRLSLGEWVGVSGAAFTTGMGANTSLPLSFLLCLFNVRLGYWWQSHDAFRKPGQPPVYPGAPVPHHSVLDYSRRLLPAQDALLDEMTARLRGPTQPRWYLSDGGHFENTACYELIRRQVPLIVCCDCGADVDYVFDDLANLVRKARIDFGTEIEFLPSELAATISPLLGSLDDLKPVVRNDGAALSSKHAAVAQVRHRDGTHSVLLLIKPTLSADLPIDVLQYDSTERTFPQQSTLDQFFDEAQWESYRKLGRIIGEKLFAVPDGTGTDLWSQLVEYARNGAPVAAEPARPVEG